MLFKAQPPIWPPFSANQKIIEIWKVNQKKWQNHTLKFVPSNFSYHKNLLCIRTQRAKQWESLMISDNSFLPVFPTTSNHHQWIIVSSCHKIIKTERILPFSEEDFLQFANRLDVEWNSFQKVIETTERIRKILSIKEDSLIKSFVQVVQYLVQFLDAKEMKKYYTISDQPSKTKLVTQSYWGMTCWNWISWNTWWHWYRTRLQIKRTWWIKLQIRTRRLPREE